MRLIDADALKNSVRQKGRLTPGYTCSVIDEEPTVDPVKHGHWIKRYMDSWCCSECGGWICTDEYDDENSHLYCNRCGARMDEVSE